MGTWNPVADLSPKPEAKTVTSDVQLVVIFIWAIPEVWMSI